jgi:hypothetical protein
LTSRTTSAFRKLLLALPPPVQSQTKRAYRLWSESPQHPGLRFKRIHERLPIYSVRIGLGWRAVGVQQRKVMVWYWIGSHAEYDRLIKKLKTG